MNAIGHLPNPEIRFIAQLQWPSGRQLSVPATLHLPLSFLERPRLVLRPDERDWNRLGAASICQLSATIQDEALNLTADSVRIGSGSLRRWGDGKYEGTFETSPREITLVRRLNRPNTSISGTFYLSRSELLSPYDHPTYQDNGDIDWKRAERLCCEFSPGCTLRFDTKYSIVTNQNAGITLSPHLVAELRKV